MSIFSVDCLITPMCSFAFTRPNCVETQQFLLDLQGSLFGKHFKTAGVMHGLTKKANYVPGFPDQI